jgi:hypothetical protein
MTLAMLVFASLGCGAAGSPGPTTVVPDAGPADRTMPPAEDPVPWPAIREVLLTVFPGGIEEHWTLDAEPVDLDGVSPAEFVVVLLSDSSPQGFVFRRTGDSVELVHEGAELHPVRLPGSPERLGVVSVHDCCGYQSLSVWVLRPGDAAMTEVYAWAYGPADGGGVECGEDAVYSADELEPILIDVHGNRTRDLRGGPDGPPLLEALREETGCPESRQTVIRRLEDLLRQVP